ncbi:cytochrome c biogenesis protein CcsA [Flavobacterium sp. '19STA2R22 D10 B1']|uniref:cytochrome c biogenesis protein CcsA n=1 Tax=Flavobacterium aerium TaxID=3037261 RepID=UPI00278BF0A0|nr:cytochrome c biogenesis protein CcsA [Flavobacterium sp. '19STA2R22 D10 B1']
MDKKIFSFLFSTRLMAILFLSFALAMAIGTFIEDAYNTDTARILIYNAWWFEAIMVFFMINFIGNIKRYQLHKKEKWATLLLHLSFIFILLGAFVTRYISYEGVMPIREGATENQVFSDKTYLTLFVDGEYQGEMKRRTYEEHKLFSAATPRMNKFSIQDKFNNIPFEVTYENFVMGAKEFVKEDKNGVFYIKLVESGDGTRHEHFLKEGEVQNIHNVLFAFNKPTEGAVNVMKDGDTYTIKTPFEGNFMRMADQFKGSVAKDTVQPLMMRSLYNLGGTQFVFPELAIKGVMDFESNNDYKTKGDDALVLKVKSEGQEKTVTLLGAKGKMGEPQSFKLGNLEYTLFYGSKVYTLPFKIKLNKFIAEKYPGTEKNYASFESQVTILDPEKKFDARIYMNNILDHKGYRFFQAMFDPDEKGTILSVNHDEWGTWITYVGYFLLYFALMAILFDKNTRFGDLKVKLDKVKAKKAKLLSILVLLLSFNGFAQEHADHPGHAEHVGDKDHTEVQLPTAAQADSLIMKFTVSKDHAAKFGKIVIQDGKGRMKPINTFSSELLRKVSNDDHYKGLNSDQVFLSMTQFPQVWYNVPLVYLKRGNDSLRKIIGVDVKTKYAPLVSFFDERGNYKLAQVLEDANHAAVPNQFQKDFIETARKIDLLYTALSGSILKIFPIPFDENNKWVSYLELNETPIKGIDSIYTKNVLPLYMSALNEANKTDGYKNADKLVESVEGFQKKYGSKVRPTDRKIDLEILYNKYDIFKNLYQWYFLAGIVMFTFTILKIFRERKFINIMVKGSHIFVGILFALHTAGLIARWYISGHAPWSDAYESMIYVGWATMFFGLAFGRKSHLTVASTTFVAAMILWVAHMNWMDPAIANLQPVLNSYWLMIHVAVIVASYGPFALGMVLGLVSLFLMIFTNKNNKMKMDLNIQELTYITEMALTVGLVMLTIGNFLGGQWANESWGRYWGWDPKETWALISIMVYGFVIHMRLVPALRGRWIFNLVSVASFSSVLMTYFGVNFYLTGLHSYASGDKVVTPDFVYYSTAFVTIIGFFSYLKYKKFYKK